MNYIETKKSESMTKFFVFPKLMICCKLFFSVEFSNWILDLKCHLIHHLYIKNKALNLEI